MTCRQTKLTDTMIDNNYMSIFTQQDTVFKQQRQALLVSVQNNGIVKSEPKYPVCKKPLIRAFYFELFPVLLSLSWLLQWSDFFVFFLRVASLRLCSALVYAPGFANTCVVKGQPHCPPNPQLLRSVIQYGSILLCNTHIRYPAWA